MKKILFPLLLLTPMQEERALAILSHLLNLGDVDDDFDRLLCLKQGSPGHRHCGFCFVHNKARFQCGCPQFNAETEHDRSE